MASETSADVGVETSTATDGGDDRRGNILGTLGNVAEWWDIGF